MKINLNNQWKKWFLLVVLIGCTSIGLKADIAGKAFQDNNGVFLLLLHSISNRFVVDDIHTKNIENLTAMSESPVGIENTKEILVTKKRVVSRRHILPLISITPNGSSY